MFKFIEPKNFVVTSADRDLQQHVDDVWAGREEAKGKARLTLKFVETKRVYHASLTSNKIERYQ